MAEVGRDIVDVAEGVSRTRVGEEAEDGLSKVHSTAHVERRQWHLE